MQQIKKACSYGAGINVVLQNKASRFPASIDFGGSREARRFTIFMEDTTDGLNCSGNQALNRMINMQYPCHACTPQWPDIWWV